MSFWLVSHWRYVPQIFLILEAELTHAALDAFSHHLSHKALATHTVANTHAHTHTHSCAPTHTRADDFFRDTQTGHINKTKCGWKLKTHSMKTAHVCRKKSAITNYKAIMRKHCRQKVRCKAKDGIFFAGIFFSKLNACSGALYFNGSYNAWTVLNLNMTHSNTSWLMHK